jgi:exopolyphosphatase
VLARANIKTSDLITLSDIPFINDSSKRIRPELTRWILVDHNALQGDLGKIYGSQVVGCIDHHDDDHKVPINTNEEPRTIRPCGSCASLVVEHCREAWTALTRSSETSKDRKIRDKTREWDSELASLALAPILIDTGNISNDKTTPTDIDSVKYLEPLIKVNKGENFTSIDYWAELREAKQSIDRLTVSEILRKDYKQWNESDITLGISSMVKTISFLIKKAGGQEKLLQGLRQHSKERGLTMCCIMASFHDGDEYTRELFLWGLDGSGARAAKQFFQDSKKELGLESWNSGELDLDNETEWRRCWWQRKTEHSRKRVAPLMRCAIERAG